METSHKKERLFVKVQHQGKHKKVIVINIDYTLIYHQLLQEKRDKNEVSDSEQSDEICSFL